MGRVAHDERGQQAGGVVRQLRRGADEPGPNRFECRHHPGRSADDVRGAVDLHDGARRPETLRRGQTPACPQVGLPGEVRPPTIADEDDGRRDLLRASARRDAVDLGRDDEALVAPGADDPVRLTPTEWALLSELVRAPGRLIGQRELLQEVWGPAYERETNYLRVYLAQLRRKLEPDPGHPRYLHTEPGMGYRFTP